MDLLERDGCLRGLNALLAEANDGQGRVALVSGEAGIGKTALIERFVHQRQGRTRVVWGTCDPQFTPRPLGPLHDMAANMHAPVPALLAAGSDRSAVFSAVLAELSNHLTIAVFEDVHWADEATLDLLGFVGRRIAQTRALLVLTYRDDELSPRHPLRLLLGDLTVSTTTRRIALAPLTADGVRVLIGERRLDAEALHRRTAGNPFFVTEVLASYGVGMPPTVRDAVLARAARLSPPAQHALQAAAVIGPRVEPWLLAAVSDVDASAIDECLALGMLVGQAAQLAFRHELARQAIVDTISPPRRISLHARALTALQSGSASRRSVARLAHHAEGAGDRRAILEYAPAAARQAVKAGAHREAAALYALAVSCADDLPSAEQAALLEAYAWESNVVDHRSDAITARRQAIAIWHATGEAIKEAENLARLVPMLIGVGQNVEAKRCSDAAVALLEALPPGPELALAYRTQALVCLADRDALEAIAWGQRAIELADRCGDEDVSAMTHIAVGSAWLLEDYPRGCEYLDQRLAVAFETGREVHVGNAFAHLGSRSAELYQFKRAERYLADGVAFTDERDLDTLSLYMLAWQSLTLMHLGRWGEAATIGRRVLLRAGMSAANRIPALVALGRLHARDKLAEAHAALDEALVLAESIGTAEALGMVRAARAERAWLVGDRARTLDEACAAYDLAVRQRHAWVVGELAFWRWRAGDTVEPLRWLAAPFADHMAGKWRAAADAWHQLGCPYEEARALADGDDAARMAALGVLQHLGADDTARRLGRELRAEGVAAVPRGPYARTRGNPFGLTTRQVDILRLIADGLSNPEIAATLSIAPKTVDHHVAAVLAKLDVHSRRAAATLAREHHLVNQK
jgi:DNA-binding CsgD family transcriptional regulator/tetratricopeptide (TPR) repeat protein